MADSRELAQVSGFFSFKVSETDMATPPPWYDGSPLFTLGKNPNFVEPLNGYPMSYGFISPFSESTTVDSFFTRTVVTRDVRNEVGTRDWSDLLSHPPTDFFKGLLIGSAGGADSRLVRRDLGFCVWHGYHQANLNSDNTYPCHLLQLDVASGGKILTKQDFKLRIKPWWYSSSSFGYMYPCVGGFSLHEVYGETLTEQESYERVAKRVVVLYMGINPDNQLPNIADQALNYVLTTDATKQPELTGLGNYWLNFCDTTWAYGVQANLRKIVYPTNGGWRQSLTFVGEFSLKQLHDYITDTDKFAILTATKPSNFSYVSNIADASVHLNMFGLSSGSRYNLLNVDEPDVGAGNITVTSGEADTNGIMYATESWVRDWLFTQLPKYDPAYHPSKSYTTIEQGIKSSESLGVAGLTQRARMLSAYDKGSYYSHVKRLRPPTFVEGGKADTVPPSYGMGIYSYNYIGAVKIEAYTFDGAIPTPYKPVYLIERDTGRLIRETISDKDGKYVLHGVPSGIDYIAVSIDPTKTFSSTVEDFGVVGE